jgi:exonuclease VII large subunit
VKVEPLVYCDRNVYSVSAFNRGVGTWLVRLPTLWIEGEVTELRRRRSGERQEACSGSGVAG